jgi:hypothetical protein
MSLLPPSEATQYTDWKAMVAALQVHARDNGYAIRTPFTAIPLVLEPAIAQTGGRPNAQTTQSHRTLSTQATRARLAASSTCRSPSALNGLVLRRRLGAKKIKMERQNKLSIN